MRKKETKKTLHKKKSVQGITMKPNYDNKAKKM